MEVVVAERDANSELRHYRAELAAARREVERARKAKADAIARSDAAEVREHGLQAVVAGLEALAQADRAISQERLPIETSEASKPSTNGAQTKEPRGREAVLRIMKQSGIGWRYKPLTREVVLRGWMKPDARNPEAAIRRTIERLYKDGEVEQLEPGLYRYKVPGDAGEPDNRG